MFDRTLQARERAIAVLKFNLKKVQDIMKSQADKHMSDMKFAINDWVHLKLQPYMHIISLPLDSGHVLVSDENQKTMHKFQPILPCGFGCNRVGYPMEAVNIFEKYRCKSGGCILRWQCYAMREFRKPVHYHPYSHFSFEGGRTAPIATPDASVVISNGFEKFGSANVISCNIAVLSDWNAFSAFSFQVKVACFRISVSGEAMCRCSSCGRLMMVYYCVKGSNGILFDEGVEGAREYLRGSRLVLLWRNGWWRWCRWGQLSLFGICEHGGEIFYGIGLVCHGGGLCGDVSEEGGGQLDEGLDIGGGGSVFESRVFFRRNCNENESTK
uniref:Ty3/gypsy retrotransposon protein n=1 Tax=Tanacetum cinerariifolium TaxID=118510 RepID=A0A6L2LI98_TANCI|nr:Ty3/gypsy retrotransposon protein [Tanacetum cinerariifolium]